MNFRPEIQALLDRAGDPANTDELDAIFAELEALIESQEEADAVDAWIERRAGILADEAEMDLEEAAALLRSLDSTGKGA